MSIDPSNLAGTAVLTFDDEFNSLSLWNGSAGTWDTNAWWNPSNGFSRPNNGELEWYINANDPDTASVKPWSANNGVLSLTANPASAAIQPYINNYQYTSGSLTSFHSFSQTYGYFETRAEVPAGQGLWPAFWLVPTDGSWPPEIDILEMIGNNTTQFVPAAHWGTAGAEQNAGGPIPVADMSTGFHTYGLDWEPDYLTWYFDGQKVFQIATPAQMNTPMYMLLNLAVGGYWPGAPTSSAEFPASFKVDYVRVYKSAPASASPPPPPPPAGGSGQVLQAVDGGSNLVAGSGGATLIGAHGPDVMTGGAGADVFKFVEIPWSGATINNFDPSADKIDLSALLAQAGYSGTNPIGDGYIKFWSDGGGDTVLYFDASPSTNPWGDYIAKLTGVGPSVLTASSFITTGSAPASPPPPPPPPPPASGQVLQASDGGSNLVAPASGATMIGAHGPDVMTGGAGNDVFKFVEIPWANATINSFDPALDKIDVSALLSQAGYSGSNPIADGYIKFWSDGSANTILYFDAHPASDPWGSYVAKINGVGPSALGLSSFITTASGLSISPPAASQVLQATDGGSNLTAPAGGATIIGAHGPDVMTGGAGADVFKFVEVPWQHATINGFTPGQDHIDVSALLHQAGYSGSDPIGAGYVKVWDDGSGNAIVYFDASPATNAWGDYLATVTHTSAAELHHASDWIFT